MSGAEKYARWVLDSANQVETGRLIKLAAQRFLSDLLRKDMYFDEDEAVKMANFGERYCCQWEGDWAGKPVIFEPWQRFIFEQVFGWFWTDSKLRRFEDVYVQVAKKNGKSTMCAVLMDFHLMADERVNTPKVFTAANNEEQAKICVNMAGRIIEFSPELADYIPDKTIRLFSYKEEITEIAHTGRNGFIRAFAKESGDKTLKTAGGKHGVNASLGIVDEFGMSPDHGASKPIKTSMASRKEPLMFTITTSGFNLSGPCYTENRKVGIQVLEGIVQKDNYLPIIFEIDPPIKDGKPDQITATWLLEHPEVWRHANPNVDVSVHRKFLKGALEDAIQYGGTTAVDNLTLNFNIWMQSAEVFISAETWAKNTHEIKEEDLLGQECFGGVEFISGKMMNAFCFVFPDVGGKTVVKPIFWMPAEFIKEHEDEFKPWVSAGLIHTDVGNVFDNDKAKAIILCEIQKYNMHSFAFKKSLEHSDIVQALIKEGYQGDPISHGVQGISTPTVLWEELLNGFHVEHFGNPVLTWMNSNCLAKRKDNDIRLEKSGSKVVGIYAAINALAQWKTIMAGETDDKLIERW
jgi:phage terminase large subunit-like protein